MSGRTRKIESLLKEIVGEEVDALSDPRINGLVTVTAVRVSPDLAQATVFFSTLSEEGVEDATEGLNSAAGRRQSVVARQMRVKRTPRHHFEPDPVVENVGRLEAALQNIRREGDGADQNQ